MKKNCELIGEGKIQYCYLCPEFPCRRLKNLDKSYRTRYHMSMIENLTLIKEQGIEKFLDKESAKWQCPECGGVISCHNGFCFSCEVKELKEQKKKSGWIGD
jgi:hypothetical protein